MRLIVMCLVKIIFSSFRITQDIQIEKMAKKMNQRGFIIILYPVLNAILADQKSMERNCGINFKYCRFTTLFSIHVSYVLYNLNF